MKSKTNNNKQEVRKLTPHDLAFGIGRPATIAELDLLMEDMENETFTEATTVMKRISKNLQKKNQVKSVKGKV